MIKKHEDLTAIMTSYLYCRECGWPIVDVRCNDEFIKYKDASKYYYWSYCSNKGCKNHEGSGYDMDIPEWIGY